MKKNTNMHLDYYEAILQIRPAKEEVINYVYELLKQNNIRISKIVESKNGIDLYLDNQKFTRGTLAKQLKKRFKGELKITRSLYGVNRNTSRLVYRGTVLFRLKE